MQHLVSRQVWPGCEFVVMQETVGLSHANARSLILVVADNFERRTNLPRPVSNLMVDGRAVRVWPMQ
jgi:hypothetical protein